MMKRLYLFLVLILIGLLSSACQPGGIAVSGASAPPDDSQQACAETEPAWVIPPVDSAVLNKPDYGYYFVNEDQSIWVAAPKIPAEDIHWRAGENGNKAGWFRPEGADLEISGRRVDGEAEPLKADLPCCYPTRFQASGLYFSAPGCWEITARAAGSTLTFLVTVDP